MPLKKEIFKTNSFTSVWTDGSTERIGAKAVALNSRMDVAVTGERTQELSIIKYPAIYESNQSAGGGLVYDPTKIYPSAVLTCDGTKIHRFYEFPTSQRKPMKMHYSELNTTRVAEIDTKIPTYNSAKSFIGNQTRYKLKSSQITVATYDADTPAGLRVNSRITADFFGLSNDNCQSIRVFKVECRVCNVNLPGGLDGTYYFKDNLDLALLKKIYRPMTMRSVDYGSILYIAVATKKANAKNASLDLKSSSPLNIKKVGGNVIIKMRMIGSAYQNYNSATKSYDVREVAKAISLLKGIDWSKEEILPISYTINDLYNCSSIMSDRVYQYYPIHINTIKLKVEDACSGCYINGVKFHWLQPVRDSKTDSTYYTHKSVDKKPTYYVDVSPLSLCLEFKVDVKGSTKCDYNFFIPYIPLSRLSIGDDGVWIFNIWLNCLAGLLDVEGSVLFFGSRYNAGVEESYWAPDNQVYLRNDNFYDGCDTTYKNRNENGWLAEYLQWTKNHSKKLNRIYKISCDGVLRRIR